MDIAVKLSVIPGTQQGVVIDGFSGLHPFNGAPADSASAYWPNRAIARDVVATAQGGYTVDGSGGIHAFGSASPLSPSGSWPNWDVVRGIDIASAGSGAYTADGSAWSIRRAPLHSSASPPTGPGGLWCATSSAPRDPSDRRSGLQRFWSPGFAPRRSRVAGIALSTIPRWPTPRAEPLGAHS